MKLSGNHIVTRRISPWLFKFQDQSRKVHNFGQRIHRKASGQKIVLYEIIDIFGKHPPSFGPYQDLRWAYSLKNYETIGDEEEWENSEA